MIALNKTQAQFYDKIHEADEHTSGYAENEAANLITRAIAKLRYQQQRAVKATGIDDRVRELHVQWTAEKAGGNFLEIGCFNGSRYTFELIDAAGDYTGVELSSAASASLRQKIADRGQSTKANIVCGDFLDYTPNHKFDFICTHGVLHHFENPELLFAKIRTLIKDDGFLVFVEPVAINLVFRALRSIYRPFQSDAAWEWPFRKTTVAELTKRFNMIDGFGWGRFSALISLACGAPMVGSAVLPAYLWIARKEISNTRQSSYWLNSHVVAKCLPKSQ